MQTSHPLHHLTVNTQDQHVGEKAEWRCTSLPVGQRGVGTARPLFGKPRRAQAIKYCECSSQLFTISEKNSILRIPLV